MIGKAVSIWGVFAFAAVLNGILREAILRKRFGEGIAHVLSTLLLSAIVLAVAFISRDWLGIPSIEAAWLISACWLLATLAFEFIAGHYLFGNAWSKILADYDVSRGRVWLLIPATILFAAPLAYSGLKSTWLIPYLISNLIASAILLSAVAKPNAARWIIVAMFLYAGVYNIWLGTTKPQEYQGFADMAIVPWYRDFIRGPLREQGGALIPAIGAGQLLIAATGALGGRWLAFSMAGCCVFLLAIAPLGIGSACPFSFIVSLAAIVLATQKAMKT